MGDHSSATHVDLVSTGSEESIRLWLKHYADEQTRRDWRKRYPDYELPPHEEPRYDRDSRLPEPDDGLLRGE